MDELGNGNHLQPHVNRPGAADRLREMLARTAQDHVSGQRSNASALEDIRQRLDGLAAAIVGLTEKLAALDARLERIDERHEDHYDRVSAIEGHLGEQGQGLSSLEDSLLILAEALLCPQGRHAPPPREGPLREVPPREAALREGPLREVPPREGLPREVPPPRPAAPPVQQPGAPAGLPAASPVQVPGPPRGIPPRPGGGGT